MIQCESSRKLRGFIQPMPARKLFRSFVAAYGVRENLVAYQLFFIFAHVCLPIVRTNHNFVLAALYDEKLILQYDLFHAIPYH